MEISAQKVTVPVTRTVIDLQDRIRLDLDIEAANIIGRIVLLEEFRTDKGDRFPATTKTKAAEALEAFINALADALNV